MKRLTAVAIVCLLLTSFVNAQNKSSRKSSPSGGVRAPKPLPAPPVPPDLGPPLTPEMEQQLIESGPWRPAPKPNPWVVPVPEKAIIPIAKVARAQEPDCISQKTVRCVRKGSLYVRSDPNSFVVDTLNDDDYFRVRAVRRKGEKCDYYGDAIGSLNLKKVWVGCGGLDTVGLPTPRPAVPGEFHQSGKKKSPSVTTTREHLRDRFGGKLLPENKAGNNGRLRVMPKLLDRFDPNPDLNKITVFARQDPLTGKLIDPVSTIDFNEKTRKEILARYIIKGGNIAVVNVRSPGQKSGTGIWGLTNLNRARLVKPGNK